LPRAGKLGLFLAAAAFLSLPAPQSAAPQPSSAGQNDPQLKLDTEAVAPLRFIAAHGRRALVDGYAADGLEVWAYPFQILSVYRVAFLPHGATTPIRGQDILSRVTYEPDSVTRTYLGPDFIVREKIFVPLDEPGAVFSYKVEGGLGVEIEVHATPVLDLMWPGALGGQGAGWDPSLSAFVLSEPADGYSAVVGSPDIVAHDEMANRTAGGENPLSLGFTLRPGNSGSATVFVALNPPHAADTGALFQQLIRNRQTLEANSSAHIQERRNTEMRVETPEPQVNEAIAWAETALDQVWVCNPDLGCGFVAGYGPSRGARRPQYDWFFAGDGLVAADAAIDLGDYPRARQELEFILRYRDQKTGMIWHELSQSAGLIDWAGKFPYMFVHVDITFQFLAALDHYIVASGDVAFATGHWEAIEAAYRYCRSTIDPASGLPRIPAGKSGGDEQDRISDDLGLSTSWVHAASSFAHLASLTLHAALANEATQASQLAATSIPTRYWNARQSFWVSGHTSSGQDAPEQRSAPAEALTMHLFTPEQNTNLFDRLASAAFQTDWGTRGVGAGSAGYDPTSYAKGSVWAVGTASLAEAFWSEHRPVTALGLWRALLPWSSLDSLGHMDEVLAGNFYRPQTESVPEQTWSSAGFLSATVHGLLGLNVDSVANRLAFAPHLPAAWGGVSIEHIKLSDASVAVNLKRAPHKLTLSIDNPGPPFKFDFTPEIPLGARIVGAELDHLPIAVALDSHPQETDAHAAYDAPHGKSEFEIGWLGGVSVMTESPAPLKGMPSTGIRVVGVHLEDDLLTITADVPRDRACHIQLQTDWEIVKAEGALAQTAAGGQVDLTFAANPDAAASEPYRQARAVVQFKR
jgi:glycogen debranching enzyme